MTWRFRRRLHVLPGIDVNLAKHGASVSLGVPGAHVTVAPHRPTRITAGLPGTGLSITETAAVADRHVPPIAARAPPASASVGDIGATAPPPRRRNRIDRRIDELRGRLHLVDAGDLVMNPSLLAKTRRELAAREWLRDIGLSHPAASLAALGVFGIGAMAFGAPALSAGMLGLGAGVVTATPKLSRRQRRAALQRGNPDQAVATALIVRAAGFATLMTGSLAWRSGAGPHLMLAWVALFFACVSPQRLATLALFFVLYWYFGWLS